MDKTTRWTTVEGLKVEVAHAGALTILLEAVAGSQPLWGAGLSRLEPGQSAVVLALAPEQARELLTQLSAALAALPAGRSG